MPQTNGQEVIQYLDDIRIVSEDFYQITLQVRDIFLTTLPSLTESIKYGGIVFSINKDLMAGIFVYKKHISIEFSHGIHLTDPDSILEGKGKHRRHIKLKTTDEINTKKVIQFIQEAVEI